MERRNVCQARSGGIGLKRLRPTNREKKYFLVITRFLSWSLLCAFVIMAGCGKLRLKEDHYKCDPDGGTGACPAGWTCRERRPGSEDFRCFRSVGNSDFPVCGNNIKEDGEECDGMDLGGQTCQTRGFYGGGELGCLDDCSDFDTSGCEFDSCGDGWVLIQAGDFQMGCNNGDQCWGGIGNESPRHTVTLSAYCIQRTQVSVAEYRECWNSGACIGPPRDSSWDYCNWTVEPQDREDHPINCVNWADSREYCQWVGGDLPSEAQWEKAARGTDSRTYPWGDSPEPHCERCNFNYCGDHSGTWPVGYITGTTGDSPFGLKDMCGNVKEWTLDCFDMDIYKNRGENSVDPVNRIDDCTGNRVLRGGGFQVIDARDLRVVYRFQQGNPVHRYSPYGIRCARSPAEQTTGD